MNILDLKTEVSQAIQTEWATFAQSHPRLAAVIDQTLLVEQAVLTLADDPQYQQAMTQAQATGVATEEVREVIGVLVKAVIRSMV